ncbi:MAG: peptidoglycan DD-metalloendopeptidase family protein [Eggerthellaceae bacterium]|nr:peptidoglycan DD-metalloendopeptidase family protein [Eggerthellaceae bacterium]
MQKDNTHRTLFSPYVIGLCILAILLAFIGVPKSKAYALTSAELFAEVEEIIGRIDVLQTDLNYATADYELALDEYEAATAAMHDAEARARAAEARIAELQVRLGERATNMYKKGLSSYLDVIFGVTSFEEFLTSWDIIEKISALDAELVRETKDRRAEAEAARKDYSEQQAVAASKMARAEELRLQIASMQQALKEEAESIRAEAMELLAEEELEAERARQAAEAAEAKRKQLEAAAAAQVSQGAGMSVISGSGVLAHPCPTGFVSSTFGWRNFDNAFHQGSDFAAPQGTPIYAADSGTVIYATYDGGWNGGAGNWVVIAHGNGVVTKYMHASAVYVSIGQQVERGQNIAGVGNTGYSTGAHLHFQVEVNGVAVDPFLFL